MVYADAIFRTGDFILALGDAAGIASRGWTLGLNNMRTSESAFSTYPARFTRENSPGVDPTPTPVPSVPEPSTWASFITGFGLIGLVARRRRYFESVAA